MVGWLVTVCPLQRVAILPNANMLPVQVVTLLCFASRLVVHDTTGCASARTYMQSPAGQGLVIRYVGCLLTLCPSCLVLNLPQLSQVLAVVSSSSSRACVVFKLDCTIQVHASCAQRSGHWRLPTQLLLSRRPVSCSGSSFDHPVWFS